MGAGWTAAATKHFFEVLQTDSEKLAHLLAMFTITEAEYRADPRATTTIDFHMGNAVFCGDAGFDIVKSQLVLRILGAQLEAFKAAEDPEALGVFDALEAAMGEGHDFTDAEVSALLKHVAKAVYAPRRLLWIALRKPRAEGRGTVACPVFSPRTTPLGEFREDWQSQSEAEFPILSLGKAPALRLGDLQKLVGRYVSDVVTVIGVRCGGVEAEIEKLRGLSS